MMNKGIAGILTIGFMWGVRPDTQPSMAVTALLTLLMYEAILYCIRYIQRMKRQKRQDRNRFYRKRDGRRWADEWIKWPMKEVV